MLPISLPFSTITLAYAIGTLVALLSFFAIVLRLYLYSHLTYLHGSVKKLICRETSSLDLQANLDRQPEMFQRLFIRFGKASKLLEQVNTPALIEQVYSQEKIGLFSCEQIDYFCRILPNSLIAFGLIGTFLGLTINLSTLSQTLNFHNTSDINTLISELQKPLASMGLAFIASLAALFCSTALTFFNFKVNTALARLQLFSSLEDYLDNIYYPTVEGHSRLDKAVEKMVFEFRDFLSRFGETVRDAVESSLGNKIKEINDANKETNAFAQKVYDGFLAASGTLQRGAAIFQDSAAVFERTQFPDKITSLVADFTNVHQEVSGSLLLLSDAIKSTDSATKLLHTSVTEVARLNEKTTNVLELTQANQQSLGDIIPQLHAGAEVLQSNTEKLKELQDQVTVKSNSLGDIQFELAKLVETFQNHIAAIVTLNQKTTDVLEVTKTNEQSLIEIIPQLHEGAQMLQPAAKTLDKLQSQVINKSDNLGSIQLELSSLVRTITNHTEQISLELKTLGDRLIKAVEKSEDNNYKSYSTKQTKFDNKPLEQISNFFQNGSSNQSNQKKF